MSVTGTGRDSPEERAAALADLHEEIRVHGGCGFEPCEAATNMVPGDGDPGAAVMMVGEAPGASEDQVGRPFVGRAGRLLDTVLQAAGLRREDVYVTNVVKARPPGNRDPRGPEIAHCMPWLESELELVRPRLVVPLGRHALTRFAPGRKITEVAGTRITGAGPPIFPLLHPAAALRSSAMRERLLADAGRLSVELAELGRG